MALNAFSRSLRTLRTCINDPRDPLVQCLAPRLSRTMATEAQAPSRISRGVDQLSHQAAVNTVGKAQGKSLGFSPAQSYLPATAAEVLTTIYKFPTMEPLRFESYSSKHLYLPLRKDILHLAVVFEGDATRQGTASSKTRFEVHGGHRKIRPQKGTGMARLGTRQSPMLKGGGKSFGPHPRDFSTKLPRKMYDLAWRTALSYRYRKGELIVCEDGMDIDYAKTRYLKQIFEHNGWGNANGRSLVITSRRRNNLFWALDHAGEDGRAQTEPEVDVKDLLELGRIIIEKSALDKILNEHQSDLVRKVAAAVAL